MRSSLCARAPQFGKPAVEAAGAVDAENASTAPWKTAKNAVSHSYHRPLFFTSVTQKVLPMLPVNSVTYVPGCTWVASRVRERESVGLGVISKPKERARMLEVLR